MSEGWAYPTPPLPELFFKQAVSSGCTPQITDNTPCHFDAPHAAGASLSAGLSSHFPTDRELSPSECGLRGNTSKMSVHFCERLCSCPAHWSSGVAMVELLPPPTGLWSLPNIPLFLSLSVKLKLVQLAYRKAERKPLFSLAQDLVVVVLASHEPQSPFLLLSSLPVPLSPIWVTCTPFHSISVKYAEASVFPG